jgi:hypothetical protein
MPTVCWVSDICPQAGETFLGNCPKLMFFNRRIDDRVRKVRAEHNVEAGRDLEPLLLDIELVHERANRLRRCAARLLLRGEQLEPERRQSFR